MLKTYTYLNNYISQDANFQFAIFKASTYGGLQT